MRRQATATGRRPAGRRPLARLAAAAAAAAAALLLWETWIEPRWVPKRWGEVVPGVLFRSGQVSAPLVERQLGRHGIRLVIDLSEARPGDPDQEAEQRAAEALGIEFHRLPLAGDGRGDPRHYVEALALTREALAGGRPTLVHCTAGAQRIGGFVALYRALYEQRGAEAIRREMRRYGWRPDRDAVLLDYLNENLPAIAEALVERGALGRVPDPPPRF